MAKKVITSMSLDTENLYSMCRSLHKEMRVTAKELAEKFKIKKWSRKDGGGSTPSTPSKIAPTMSFASSSKSINVGSTVTQKVTTNSLGAVTYSSSKPAIATVNSTSGLVSGITSGSTTITATQVANGNYTSGKTSYTVTVSASTTPPPRPTTTYYYYIGTTAPTVSNLATIKTASVTSYTGITTYGSTSSKYTTKGNDYIAMPKAWWNTPVVLTDGSAVYDYMDGTEFDSDYCTFITVDTVEYVVIHTDISANSSVYFKKS